LKNIFNKMKDYMRKNEKEFIIAWYLWEKKYE
jgi:hypothetical protein